jgi:hypothetical protein
MTDYHDGRNAHWKRYCERRKEDRTKFIGKSKEYRRGWLDSVRDVALDERDKYREFDRDPAFNVNAMPDEDVE